MLRLKMGDSTYIISGDQSKIIQFVGMFFMKDLTICEVKKKYIYVTSDNSENMTAKDIQAIATYAEEAKMDKFQSYEDFNKIEISMSNNQVEGITALQKGYKDLIEKFSTKAKKVVKLF